VLFSSEACPGVAENAFFASLDYPIHILTYMTDANLTTYTTNRATIIHKLPPDCIIYTAIPIRCDILVS
jgi:hypothetical protein